MYGFFKELNCYINFGFTILDCGLHEYGISYDDKRGRLSYQINDEFKILNKSEIINSKI